MRNIITTTKINLFEGTLRFVSLQCTKDSNTITNLKINQSPQNGKRKGGKKGKFESEGKNTINHKDLIRKEKGGRKFISIPKLYVNHHHQQKQSFFSLENKNSDS